VANGLADKTQAAIGTALPGVILILISCFAPMALFKLLAFVDPGTSSGAAVRQGLAAQGGLQGLLGGMSGSQGSSSAASSTDGSACAGVHRTIVFKRPCKGCSMAGTLSRKCPARALGNSLLQLSGSRL
jgi:hypothetical protein